jgi:hypothetical protein
MITAAALVAAAAGLASQADAARFVLTANNYIYNGSFADAGASTVEREIKIGGASIDGRSPSIAFSSNGTLYATLNASTSGSLPGGLTHGLYTVNNFASATTAELTLVTSMANNTPSFDFMGSGANEQLIGVRQGGNGSFGTFIRSAPNNFASINQNVGATGVNGSFPATAWTGSQYIGVTGGANEANRLFYTVNTTTGAASALLDGSNNQIALDFVANDPYGTIALSGGDYAGGEFYISFWSAALDAAVIGTVDLSNGLFSELARFDVNGSPPEAMGLAIVIPTPLAGVMGGAGLMLVGARRRRNG